MSEKNAHPEADKNRSDARPASNGHGPTTNGHDPFTDVFDLDEAEDWQADLPTEMDAEIKPSAIYAPAKLRALVKQRDTDREAYLDLVRRLVTAADDAEVTRAKVDDAVKSQARQDRQEMKAAVDEDADKENVIDALIRLGKRGNELFHAPDGQAYVTVTVDGHHQTLRVTGGTFRDLILNRRMAESGRAASIDALKAATTNLAALANKDTAPKYPVFPRIGEQGGRIYVDRGSAVFDAYEIEPAERLSDGGFRPVWRVIANSPVTFIRPEGAPIGELPIAKTAEERERNGDGDIEKFRYFLALPDENDVILGICWVLGGYRVHGDKADALMSGEGGSGKTSTGRSLCALIDPLPPCTLERVHKPVALLDWKDRASLSRATHGPLCLEHLGGTRASAGWPRCTSSGESRQERQYRE